MSIDEGHRLHRSCRDARIARDVRQTRRGNSFRTFFKAAPVAAAPVRHEARRAASLCVGIASIVRRLYLCASRTPWRRATFDTRAVPALGRCVHDQVALTLPGMSELLLLVVELGPPGRHRGHVADLVAAEGHDLVGLVAAGRQRVAGLRCVALAPKREDQDRDTDHPVGGGASNDPDRHSNGDRSLASESLNRDAAGRCSYSAGANREQPARSRSKSASSCARCTTRR
jgi:hypothetical protein